MFNFQISMSFGKDAALLVLLGILFIVLRLIGIIDWSWFWVIAPIIVAIIIP